MTMGSFKKVSVDAHACANIAICMAMAPATCTTCTDEETEIVHDMHMHMVRCPESQMALAISAKLRRPAARPPLPPYGYHPQAPSLRGRTRL